MTIETIARVEAAVKVVMKVIVKVGVMMTILWSKNAKFFSGVPENATAFNEKFKALVIKF